MSQKLAIYAGLLICIALASGNASAQQEVYISSLRPLSIADTGVRISLDDGSALVGSIVAFGDTSVTTRILDQLVLTVDARHVVDIQSRASADDYASLGFSIHSPIPADSTQWVIYDSFRQVSGYVQQRAGWVTVYQSFGSKTVIPRSRVTVISKRSWGDPSYDPLSARAGVLRNSLSKLSVSEVQYTGAPMHPPRYWLAPSVHIGKTVPTGSASGDLASSIGVIAAAILPSLAPNWLGEYLAASFESRSLNFDRADETGASVRYAIGSDYLTITPGISLRGLISVGFMIGLPVRTTAEVYRDDASPVYQVRLSAENLLLEPRVMLGIPLSHYFQHVLMAHLSAGYPLTPLFREDAISIESQRLNVKGIRIPDIEVGISYAFAMAYSGGRVEAGPIY